ncbi:MAG: TldD/PmbA family protein [Desulfobacteraceae bacterium]|nr:TldD/PmbA family protein [Desulfobacteraceae bacterium]
MTDHQLKHWFLDNLPDADFCSLRLTEEKKELIHVRKNVLEPVNTVEERGFMVTVVQGKGMGYGATCDISEVGLKTAVANAMDHCRLNQKYPLIDFSRIGFSNPSGERKRYVKTPWESVSLEEKTSFAKKLSENLQVSDQIVDWQVILEHKLVTNRYITSTGGDMVQAFSYVFPKIFVMANKGAETQRRSLGWIISDSRQGGWELLSEDKMRHTVSVAAEEALELVDAPNCPSGKMDVLLDSGQMNIQVHESVGHPLEIDRILGDERNFAGTSFVTPEMFGSYRYGSDLMNITFDPTRPYQLASYEIDDEGAIADKSYLIENGILRRGLGSVISQARSGIPGVANARAVRWNRPPIDRMANLNLESGTSSFNDMVAAIERGIYMQTNLSWSIDDSRNKFQFGCEFGRLIENGRLTSVVKNPNYRGISGIFWRNLKMVGNEDTFHVMGTPNCGKGEPNQTIHVGHATPACLFTDVDVFGGENQ